MGSVNYGTGKNGRLRKELMVVLMDRYSNLESVMRHNEDVWSREELAGSARCILDALSDLSTHRNLQEVTDSLEICGILNRKEALHFKAKTCRLP